MRAILMLATLTACGRPPEAPQELDELSHYLYREWDSEDPRVMQAGVENLAAFLRKQDLSFETSVMDRSWEISSIEAADVKGVNHPSGRNLSDTIAVGVAAESAFSIDDHATVQTRTDQLPVEPSAVFYERSFPDEDEPRCFHDAECEVLGTVNDVERKNLLMAVEFLLYKNIRWVELDSGERAMVSRSWLEESAEGANGKTTIWQSFSLDTWLSDGKRTLRYQVLWSEADVAGASDAIQLGTVKSATDDAFKAADAFLGGE
ncbi:MAG: hypothetical protein ACI8PZ_004571 [Myxococcota bacterium]|jgi:hypothetical protein